MSNLHLLFKIIRQLKTKAVILALITLAAEAAVVYMAGLYRLPKQYQDRINSISNEGGYVYFDTLGQKVDIESLLSGNKAVEDVLYVSFVSGLQYKEDYYYLKAVSSEKCFSKLSDTDTEKSGSFPRIISSRSVLKGNSVNDIITATLFAGNDKTDAEFVISGIVPDDDLIMNFQTGSNATTAYNILSQCGNDVYVLIDESLTDFLLDTVGFEGSVLFPANGIVLFSEGSDRDTRFEIINMLLANNISVQGSSEIEEKTMLVSKNIIDTYSAIPLLIMALSLASSFAVIVMSIDSETKTIALIELVGCSKKRGNALLICAFSLLLVPGVLVNSAFILTCIAGGRQLVENISITAESLLMLGVTVLAFLAIITATTLALKRQNSHVQRVIEEI